MDFLKNKYSQQVSELSHGKNYFYTVVEKTKLGFVLFKNSLVYHIQIQRIHLDHIYFLSPRFLMSNKLFCWQVSELIP